MTKSSQDIITKRLTMSQMFRITLYILVPLLSSLSLIYKTLNGQSSIVFSTNNPTDLGPAAVEQPTGRLEQRIPPSVQDLAATYDNCGIEHIRMSSSGCCRSATSCCYGSFSNNNNQTTPIITRSPISRTTTTRNDDEITETTKTNTRPGRMTTDERQLPLIVMEDQSLADRASASSGAELDDDDLAINLGAKLVIFVIICLLMLVVGASFYDRNLQLAAHTINSLDHQANNSCCCKLAAGLLAAEAEQCGANQALYRVTAGSRLRLQDEQQPAVEFNVRRNDLLLLTTSDDCDDDEDLELTLNGDLMTKKMTRNRFEEELANRTGDEADEEEDEIVHAGFNRLRRRLALVGAWQRGARSARRLRSLGSGRRRVESKGLSAARSMNLVVHVSSGLNRARLGGGRGSRRRQKVPLVYAKQLILNNNKKTTNKQQQQQRGLKIKIESGCCGYEEEEAVQQQQQRSLIDHQLNSCTVDEATRWQASAGVRLHNARGALARSCAAGPRTLLERRHRASRKTTPVSETVKRACCPQCRSFKSKSRPTSRNNNQLVGQQQHKAFHILVREVILSFSVYKNAALILDDFGANLFSNSSSNSGEQQHQQQVNQRSKQAANSTDCLHGLRFISMLWVIMIHSYSFALDWLNFDRDPRMEPFNIYKSYLGQMLSNGSFACDTFLVIAGFLLAYISIDKLAGKTNTNKQQHDSQRATSQLSLGSQHKSTNNIDCDHDRDSDNSSAASHSPTTTSGWLGGQSAKQQNKLVKSSSMSSLDSGLSDDCSQASSEASRGLAGSCSGRSMSSTWDNESSSSFSDSSSSSSSLTDRKAPSSEQRADCASRTRASSTLRRPRNKTTSSMNKLMSSAANRFDFDTTMIQYYQYNNNLTYNKQQQNCNYDLSPISQSNSAHQIQHKQKKTGIDRGQLTTDDSPAAFTFASLMGNLLHRYLRMMPLMMAIIALNTNLLAYFGSGPRYNSSTMMFDRWCRTNWWLNLIFIHNLTDTRHMCLGHSWYSAVDFQLFIVGQILLFIFYKLHTHNKRSPASMVVTSSNNNKTTATNTTDKTSDNNNNNQHANTILKLVDRYNKHLILTSLCLLLISSSQLYTGLITYFYQLPMIPMMPNFSLESNILYCVKIYIKPHCRASPYFIGFLLAYYMRLNKARPMQLKQWQALLGWSISLATMLAIVLTTTPIFNGIMPNFTFIALYGSLARPIWSCAIGWVIFASMTNNGGLLGKLLAAKCLIPFSRLTYPVYLIHPVIMAAFYGSRQSYFQFSHYLMFCLIFGFIVITYASAFIFSLVFELPVQSVEKAIRKYNQARQGANEQLPGQKFSTLDNNNNNYITIDTTNHIGQQQEA